MFEIRLVKKYQKSLSEIHNIHKYISKTILFLFIISCPGVLFAQNPTFGWAGSMGSAGIDWDQGASIVSDDSGNVYVAGQFSGTVDFDPGSGVFNLSSDLGSYDAFVCKLDAQGSLVWAKKIGGNSSDYGLAVALDTLGNVYVGGDFAGTVDFNPGSGVYNLTSKGDEDVFILKLTVQGNFIWAKHMGGSAGDYLGSIVVNEQGAVYSTGSFLGTADFDPGSGIFNLVSAGNTDIFISKLDASGNFVWAKRLGGPTFFDEADEITLDASGNVYTTGGFGGTVDFDPGGGTFNLTSVGQEDIFISKLDTQGNFIWAVEMGGGCWEGGYAIAVDHAGNIYTTGQFECTADFDPGPSVYNLTATSSNSFNIFLSKLDSQGDFVWAKNMGGDLFDAGLSITLDDCNNLYLTGEFGDTVDFDPGPGTHNLVSAGDWDIFLSKYDMQGNFIWAERMGGDSAELGMSITVNNHGNIFTTGYFTGIADFNPDPGTYNLTSAGGRDIFIQKMKQDSFSVITAQANTNSPLCAGDTLELTVNGGDNFMWSGPGGFSSTQQNPIILDADTFDSGIYTVEINKAGCTKSTSVSVTVNPLPTLTVSFNSPICSGKALILQATGGATFSWNGPNGFSDSVQNIAINPATPDNSGIYTVMTTDSNNCSNSVTIAIQVNPIYHDTVIADICQPETYQLGNQNYSSSGVYTDTLQTGAGCDSIITLKLGVHESPEVHISTEKASDRYCIGEEIVLSGNGADVYQWWSNFGEDYGDSGVAHVTLAQQHNIFWVAGFNKWNCSDTAEVVFDAEDCCQLFIPNAFSPNGDGRNDAFGVRTLAPPISFQLNIYNRWGQLVFSGQSEHDYWDGTFNGRPADLGVYNYRVSGKCIDGSVIARSGSITLLR